MEFPRYRHYLGRRLSMQLTLEPLKNWRSMSSSALSEAVFRRIPFRENRKCTCILTNVFLDSGSSEALLTSFTLASEETLVLPKIILKIKRKGGFLWILILRFRLGKRIREGLSPSPSIFKRVPTQVRTSFTTSMIPTTWTFSQCPKTSIAREYRQTQESKTTFQSRPSSCHRSR